ncbi:glycosyltransferase [Bacillus sp. EB600]|uniref:glycosyltransferase n=1 Tax=Bacillus sp. EB600 TaxID=2806345 RepID=UPI00210BA639|nr:glycosyltransferase [Bacillus sp. EB600]MCQ6278675.1 glycosyltransferase [Bacillus sp. EB600]
MKVLHLNAGNETGGGMVHILSLLTELMNGKDQFILGLFEKGLFYEKAISAGIETVTFEQSSRYDLSILFKIIRFIKEEKIDIIHTHGARANLYGYFIRKLTKVTWMTTVHSDPRNDFLGRGIIGNIFTKLNLAVLKKPDHYFAISKRFTEMLVSFGVRLDNISTILNGIDFHKKRNGNLTREDLKLSPEDFVILMIARFDPVKRHELAIEAVESFSAHHPKTKFLLVGDGQTKNEVEELVRQKGIEGNIKFLGFREDIEAIIRVADITLLTSKTESFPLVLLESSREKVPVITTDVGGVRDMIPDSSYSFVLDDANVNTIRDALEEVFDLKQEKRLEQMGEKFYNFTSKRFSVQAFAESVNNVYKMYK